MSSDWLQSGEIKDAEYLLHCYDKIRDYDAMTAEQKEKLVGVDNIKFAADGRGHDADDELVFFKRDDSRFMKTTVINYDPATEEPIVKYEEFEHSLIKARPRNYAVAKKE